MRRAMGRAALGLAAAAAVLGWAGAGRAAQVAYYPFNGNANDLGGNNYNGTVAGTEAYTSGVFGQAFSFNGSTQISSTTVDNLGLVNNSFTVAGYVRFDDPAGASDEAFFGTNTGGTTSAELHLIERGTRPLMGFFSNDTGGVTLFQPNRFYHLAFVYNLAGQTQTIYVDGVQDVSTGGHGPFVGAGKTALIGGACCSTPLNGAIDEVRVFNTALTQSEVAALVPEPGSAGVLACVAAGLLGLARRRRRAAPR